ncbi:hypothetical protein AX774_g2839 [Zancudomyces culisetae]|uniref:Uncharacterized protein n=1 Tax=Zancudomyces culisetae TaxID=1213189 RepID=A0A1R1PRP2_ZANCU|nr:hypothetical protein AX774_g2839 [Zancudomyces culisetae]|eukprot:OMH83656.1 hypothetical protein AX774_g2839 [Zancudomyces culisetae]
MVFVNSEPLSKAAFNAFNIGYTLGSEFGSVLESNFLRICYNYSNYVYYVVGNKNHALNMLINAYSKIEMSVINVHPQNFEALSIILSKIRSTIEAWDNELTDGASTDGFIKRFFGFKQWG